MPSEHAAQDTLHPFSRLSPDFILEAVESTGLWCDGRTLALNSYENRVFQVGVEGAQPLIVKFYRPGRWSRAQIEEEHQFSLELQASELPVVAPLTHAPGQCLHHWKGFDFALFPRRGGHAPELDNPEVLFMLGRLLGRLHAIGSSKPFQVRPAISVQSHARDSAELISTRFIPTGLKAAYDTLARDLIQKLDKLLGPSFDAAFIRVHGDLHRGNMLWRDDYFHFVDLDDCCQAPAIQDIWMLLSGDRAQQQGQLIEVIEGYQEFMDFDPWQLRWIEPLRTLRMMHYAAWLARRADDPAFQKAFPWFNTERYWGEHLLELREQLALLDEPPLKLAF
ncbi:MAG: serine/threonine protein kinase [Hahellaceae bacterium]|jgi:Ser/Thr protein kinase RdoA (MazF antagonist)|nr:serine/threonine protein kinase [Hahellaceae bacterium]